MCGICRIYGGKKCIQGFLWGNLREETTGRHRHRCEDNIKMDLQEVGRVAWTVLLLRIGTNGGYLKKR